MTAPSLRLLDDAVLAALRSGSGRPIADGRFADDDDPAVALATGDPRTIRAAAPWGLLFPLDGGTRSGPMSDPHADAVCAYQVTCVGADRHQARWMADKVTSVVESAAITPTGLTVTYRDLEQPGGVTPEGIVWNAFVRFRLWVTPS